LLASRGQPDAQKPLKSSLDRILDPTSDYAARLAEEKSLVTKFVELARDFLGVIERRYIDEAFKDKDCVSALAVMQHYGVPTRLLDWAFSPWVSLYFASIYEHCKDGVIGWFNQTMFEKEVDRRWDEVYHMKRYPNPDPRKKPEINPNDTAFSTDGPPWITKLHCQVPFRRIEVQQGFFTFPERLNCDHGDLIADVLSEDKYYGRFIVPASWKRDILNRLNNMNIHAKSLDYSGADKVGEKLTQELKESHRNDAKG
jgi:hypothetical protein